MAFVNELVPEEEKGRFNDTTIWKDPSALCPIHLYKWTIDRERDVFLIHLGGGGGYDPDSYYALSWHDEVIKFTANEDLGW